MKQYKIAGIVVLLIGLGVILVLENTPETPSASKQATAMTTDPHSGAAMDGNKLPAEKLNPMDVIKDVTAYLQENPDDPEALVALANANLKIGHYGEAMSLFEQVLQLDPTQVDARTNLATAKLEQGQPDAARALLEENLKIVPNDATTLLNLGVVYLEMGNTERAVGAWELWLTADNHSPYREQIRAKIDQLKSSAAVAALPQ